MEVANHIATLRTEGALLAAAAGRTSLDATIATCPGWAMRDLIRHLGGVHRWAAGYVAERRAEPWDIDLEDIVGAWPDDRDLLDWFRRGHQHLVATLQAAPADLDCYTFLTAPSPLAMWSRRQAHETTIHRVDAETAGTVRSPIEADFAADGIDELLSCFVTRPGRRSVVDRARTIEVHATDTGDHWSLRLTPERITTARTAVAADCTVTGPAAALYLMLWNRRDRSGLDIAGDEDVLDAWAGGVQIRWS